MIEIGVDERLLEVVEAAVVRQHLLEPRRARRPVAARREPLGARGDLARRTHRLGARDREPHRLRARDRVVEPAIERPEVEVVRGPGVGRQRRVAAAHDLERDRGEQLAQLAELEAGLAVGDVEHEAHG